MMDAKLKKGDLLRSAAGQVETVSERDALFQRAMIRMSTRLGSFVYDRSIGARHGFDNADAYAKEKAELVLNEALAGLSNTYVQVRSLGESIGVTITIDGESREEEVRLYGDV